MAIHCSIDLNCNAFVVAPEKLVSQLKCQCFCHISMKFASLSYPTCLALKTRVDFGILLSAFEPTCILQLGHQIIKCDNILKFGSCPCLHFRLAAEGQNTPCQICMEIALHEPGIQ